jgi:hypothetical protein
LARGVALIASAGAAGWVAARLGAGPAGIAMVVAVPAGWGLLVAASGYRAGGRDPGRWRRGAEGERATAALLATLSPRRWTVWHDLRVPRSRANIDHLVVGRTGIWVVDTKTTRAEVAAGWRSVRFGGRRLDTSPSRWEAAEVGRILESYLPAQVARPLPVRPLVAVHGHGLRRRGSRVGGVRVIPAEQVVRRIHKGRRRLRRADMEAVVEAVDGLFEGAGRR